MIADYPIQGPPDLTREQFRKILRDGNSPALGEADSMYLALTNADVRPAVLLAFFFVESKLGTVGIVKEFNTKNPGNVRSPERATITNTTVQTPRGPFARYQTWADGTTDWAARMKGPKYAGRGLLTVRQVLPVYAPSSDSNDPIAYGDTVLQEINEWAGASVMGHVPRPPITDHIVTVPPRVDGVGLNVNSWNRIPRGTVLHSMGGTLKGTDGYFDNPDCPALTDFGIGQVDAGGGFAQIIQWCDYRGRIEPWASGPVRVPEGDGPRFLATWGGAGKLNEAGISIEHDDTTLADGRAVAAGGAPVTAYQWAASVWLQAWLHAEVLGQTADTFDWNMWHREFTGAAYKACPNPRITDHVDEYQAAVKAIVRHFQEGTPYPAAGLVVNGLRLATPPEGGTSPSEGGDMKEPAPEQTIAYLNAQGQLIVAVNLGGTATKVLGANVADLGGSVENAQGDTYDRSVQANKFKPWVKRP